ncbi:DNA topoisomerase (ATP-hydrolyzing) subunit B [Candidatus Uhrbacteria bacterium]|nr:DNA topoisomerase (ATP-hydrolyzing) subunit B [Candidatus Uhrbacteria bacterium]
MTKAKRKFSPLLRSASFAGQASRSPRTPSNSPSGRGGEKREKPAGEYRAQQITVLEGLDPVRKRPGMYIGTTGSPGLHHLVNEVVDNGTDEAMAGYAKRITIRLLPDDHVQVIDDGRGIPVDPHPQFKTSALELVMTKLHAGGKFGGGGYKVSGGLHGVGVSVVNALSTWLRAEVKRDGQLWVQEYQRGIPKAKVKAIGRQPSAGTGTAVTFHPDPVIFTEGVRFDRQVILDHIRQQAYLTKGVTYIIEDLREEPELGQQLHASAFDPKAAGAVLPLRAYTFHFEGGIASFVRHLNQRKDPAHDAVCYVDKESDGIQVEVALQYNKDVRENVLAFANNIVNPEGGTHIQGFRTALTRTLNAYARAKGYLKEKDENLSGEDVREGLTAVVSVKVKDPQFEGQTKAKLGNPEAQTAVATVFGDAFAAFLEEHPRNAEAIIARCLLTAQARAAAKAARETVLRKGVLEGLTLPGKLADCSSRDPKASEMFIVEGDSAGGCFSGNTNIALTDGRELSLAELVAEAEQGKRHYCYTIMPNGRVGVERILNPRMTRRSAEVIELALDNGESITCTPDHRFMLRDGSYRQARDLTPNDALMPLRRKISELGGKITIQGYEMVYDPPRNYWIFTHMLADDFNLRNGVYAKEDGEHRHHVDFHKRNNDPDNLRRMSREDHLQLHRDHCDRILRSPEVLKKIRALHQQPDFRAKISRTMSRMRDMLSERAKKQWDDPKYKEFMKEQFLAFYHSNEEYRGKNNALLNDEQRRYWSEATHRELQSKRVKQYFQDHPEHREAFRLFARGQWNDAALRAWRSGKTKEQWTTAFRKKRRTAYDRTYYEHSMKLLADVFRQHGTLDRYDEIRRSIQSNKNFLRLDTVRERFFENDDAKLLEAVRQYNHRIIRIQKCHQRIPVYDIEVPNTHNFALASGVFVHNSAKSGRNREFQAILPLRGKILNVERARLDKMLANNEIKSLIIALGTNIGEQFDLAKLRYDRILIATDADVDGSHIKTLLLTLFWRYFPELVKQGHVYIATPPLYRIQVGKEVRYAYADEERDRILKELQEAKESRRGGAMSPPGRPARSLASARDKLRAAPTPEGEGITTEIKASIQRYKGLGEMNPEQLWETTMDPSRRLLKRVTVDDAQKADAIFDVLMGSEVEPRKKFIQTHAKTVKNLDI